MARKIDRITVFRIGVFLLACYYLAILLAGERASTFFWIFGVLLGTGYGFYWLAFNVLTFEITEPETRDIFNGYLGILSSLGGILGPLVAGWILSRFTEHGYHFIFTIALFLFALATVLSIFMQRRPAQGRYLLAGILKERSRNKNWKMITNASFTQGIREGVFAFLINLHVFLAANSEMALGIFACVNSLVSMAAYFAVGRLLKKNRRKKAIFIGGLALFLAVFLIIFRPSLLLFIIYGVIISLAYPLLLVPYLSTVYDVIGSAQDGGKFRIEYLVVRELFLNLGRSLSICTFLLLIFYFSAKTVIPYLLVIFGAGYFLIYFFIARIPELE